MIRHSHLLLGAAGRLDRDELPRRGFTIRRKGRHRKRRLLPTAALPRNIKCVAESERYIAPHFPFKENPAEVLHTRP
jgi:hypothetical protein